MAYIPGWIRLTVHIDHEGSQMNLIQDYGTAVVSPTPAQLNALCLDFWTTFSTTLLSLIDDSYVVRFIDAVDLSAPGGSTGSYTISSGGQGTRSGDPMPANVANVISWRTGRSGRSYRGRTYMFGMEDTDAFGSYFVTTYLTTLGLFALALLLYDGGPTLAVYTVVASETLAVLTPKTGYVINDVVDSQRRRLPGRGS